MNNHYRKSGYLLEDFRLFYNSDSHRREIPFHYHDFHKLLILLSGNTSYIIEGKMYALQPGDIVLVRAGQIHRPVIHDDSLYERLIFYISPAFLEREDLQVLNLFHESAYEDTSEGKRANSKADKEARGVTGAAADREVRYAAGSPAPYAVNVIRLSGETRDYARGLTMQLKKEALNEDGYAGGLLKKVKLIELLILLGRSLRTDERSIGTEVTANPLILSVMDYINSHLTDEALNIDMTAEAVSVGRSYLMHLFKTQMGYTIGQYITEKRLYMAGTLIEKGMPVTQACYQCGFKNYAAFYHAYRKKHNTAPARKSGQEPKQSLQVEGE